MKLKGKAWRFGDDIDTDVIIPARYLVTTDPEELARHCMETLDPDFSKKVKPGDIMVAGKNFGCGSSREHAPISMKDLGISCAIARTFARIFYRNAINIGLPILECPEASEWIEEGDILEVDLESGKIMNLSRGETYSAQPFPPFMQEVITAGGLVPYVAQQLNLGESSEG